MSEPQESPLSQPRTRIVGFDINHDDRVLTSSKAVDNESPTSILESLTPNDSPLQASLASSQSKLSLNSSSSSSMLSQIGDGESPPKSFLAEELKRHASMNLDSATDDHVKKGLPRLKIQRN